MTTTLGNAFETWGAPTLAGFDTTNPVNGVPLKGSSRQFVRFYPKVFSEVYAVEVKINEKTGDTKVLKTAVRDREREMVEIITPGDTNKINVIAEDYHKREFWRQYQAFRNNKSCMIGKNLDECDYVPASVVTELKYLGCHTQEQLADCSDDLCQRLPEGFMLRNMAKSMVDADLKNANLGQVNTLKKELEKAQALIAELSAAQKEMKVAISDIQESPGEVAIKKRLGRPKKEVENESH